VRAFKIYIIALAKDPKASIVAMVSKDITKKFSAGEILKNVTALAGSGVKSDITRGGAKELDKLDSAPESVYSLVKKK